MWHWVCCCFCHWFKETDAIGSKWTRSHHFSGLASSLWEIYVCLKHYWASPAAHLYWKPFDSCLSGIWRSWWEWEGTAQSKCWPWHQNNELKGVYSPSAMWTFSGKLGDSVCYILTRFIFCRGMVCSWTLWRKWTFFYFTSAFSLTPPVAAASNWQVAWQPASATH